MEYGHIERMEDKYSVADPYFARYLRGDWVWKLRFTGTRLLIIAGLISRWIQGVLLFLSIDTSNDNVYGDDVVVEDYLLEVDGWNIGVVSNTKRKFWK